MEVHTLIADVLADLPEDVCKLLNVVLHEIDLGVVILLDPVESGAILASDKVDVLVHKLDVALVLVLGLPRSQLAVVELLLQGRSVQETIAALLLALHLDQLVHLVKVVLLGEHHLRAGLVETDPDLLCVLNQNVVRGRVVLTVEVGRLDQIAEQHVCLQAHVFRHF